MRLYQNKSINSALRIPLNRGNKLFSRVSVMLPLTNGVHYKHARFHTLAFLFAMQSRLGRFLIRARFPTRFCPLSFPFHPPTSTKIFEISGARAGAGTLPPRFSIFPAILAACFPAILAACRQPVDSSFSKIRKDF
jgi:hypothetical protein